MVHGLQHEIQLEALQMLQQELLLGCSSMTYYLFLLLSLHSMTVATATLQHDALNLRQAVFKHKEV